MPCMATALMERMSHLEGEAAKEEEEHVKDAIAAGESLSFVSIIPSLISITRPGGADTVCAARNFQCTIDCTHEPRRLYPRCKPSTSPWHPTQKFRRVHKPSLTP